MKKKTIASYVVLYEVLSLTYGHRVWIKLV